MPASRGGERVSAHFQFVGIQPDVAAELAVVLRDSVEARIRRGLDVNDQPAKRLSSRGRRGGYAARKARRGEPSIRDWVYSGRTLAALVPIVAGPGEICVGFPDARAAQIAARNNARVRQFGISPNDRRNVIEAINAVRGEIVRTL
jgi:hypothetical protein